MRPRRVIARAWNFDWRFASGRRGVRGRTCGVTWRSGCSSYERHHWAAAPGLCTPRNFFADAFVPQHALSLCDPTSRPRIVSKRSSVKGNLLNPLKKSDTGGTLGHSVSGAARSLNLTRAQSDKFPSMFSFRAASPKLHQSHHLEPSFEILHQSI